MIESLALNLVGINLLAYLMVALRPRIYKTRLYKPMLTNIRLSIAPILILLLTVYFCLFLIQCRYNTGLSIFQIAAALLAFVGFCVWFLFLPNSGYLITELNFNHRDTDTAEVPLWYDIVGVLSLAMSGVLNMCFNVLCLQFLVTITINNVYQADMMGIGTWMLTVLLLILSGFGIYLGRYIRFNSWDIKHPVQFVKRILNHFTDKHVLWNCCLFVFFHSVFFIVFYIAVMGTETSYILQDLGRIWN